MDCNVHDLGYFFIVALLRVAEVDDFPLPAGKRAEHFFKQGFVLLVFFGLYQLVLHCYMYGKRYVLPFGLGRQFCCFLPLFIDIQQPVFQSPEQIKTHIAYSMQVILVRAEPAEHVMDGILACLVFKAKM